MHNEAEISVYLEWSVDLNANPSIVFQRLDSIKASGFHGVKALPQNQIGGGKRHLEDMEILERSYPDFEFFVPVSSKNEIASYPQTFYPMFDYADITTSTSVKACLSDCVAGGRKSCLWMGDLPSPRDGPIEVANGVASVIDATGGCEFVWLGHHENQTNAAEDTIKLCEELSYLDVSGPTMKSRLVVDLRHTDAEETAEECLMMGVNKFVIDEAAIQWLRDIVQENGKDFRT